MTKAQFNTYMNIYGELFRADTCAKFQVEVVRRIVNCKAMNDWEKSILLDQYYNNYSVNRCVIESIHEYNKRTRT